MNSLRPIKALQTDKGKLSCLLRSQEPRQLAFAAELGRSDHVVGFPDLWLTGWLVAAPGRDVPLKVWGPRGTRKMLLHLQQAYKYDVRIRQDDDHAAPDGIVLRVEDIGEGVVYDRGGVKVRRSRWITSRSIRRWGTGSTMPGTRKNYAGPLEVGEDLMVIEVGEKIEVRRLAHSSP